MERLIKAMSEFEFGPSCNAADCSNFGDCPALRLGVKLRTIGTNATDLSTSIEEAITKWQTNPKHIGGRVVELNTAVAACSGWDRVGKKAFEACSLSGGSNLGKGLVLVDIVTADSAILVGEEPTVYLVAPTELAEPEPKCYSGSD